MTLIHETSLGTELFLSQFRICLNLECPVSVILIISNLFYSVGAAKLKDFSNNINEFLLSGQINNNILSFELLFFLANPTNTREQNG